MESRDPGVDCEEDVLDQAERRDDGEESRTHDAEPGLEGWSVNGGEFGREECGDCVILRDSLGDAYFFALIRLMSIYRSLSSQYCAEEEEMNKILRLLPRFAQSLLGL